MATINDKYPGSQDTITSSAADYDMLASPNQPRFRTREITVGTAGDLAVVRPDGQTVIILSAIWTAQATHDVRADAIVWASTTATAIFVKY